MDGIAANVVVENARMWQLVNFRELGIVAAFFLATIGSALGCFVAGSATIGAWKKCFMQNKPAPFVMVAFAGAPLTNTIYGYILMNSLMTSPLSALQLLFAGVLAGSCLLISAFTQAKCAAFASEAYAETGQGFGNFIMIIGLCETIALFTMVFTMLLAGGSGA